MPHLSACQVLSASRLTSSLPIAARVVAASLSRPWWWSGCWLWIGPRAGRRVFGHNWLALGVFCYRDPQQRSAGPGTVGNFKKCRWWSAGEGIAHPSLPGCRVDLRSTHQRLPCVSLVRTSRRYRIRCGSEYAPAALHCPPLLSIGINTYICLMDVATSSI